MVAAFLLLFRLGEPRAPIWDEAYYLTATARYQAGTAQFASHPPLGLILIMAGDTAWGTNRHVDQTAVAATKTIRAEQLPANYSYVGVRLASALVGCLDMVLFFLLMLRLSGSLSTGLLATGLMLFDPAMLVQFRAAQLDSFQVCFLLLALHSLIAAVRRPHWLAWFGFGLCVMLAALVRANGLLIGLGGAAVVLYRLPALGWRRSAGHAAAGLAGGATGLVAIALTCAALSARPPDLATDAGRKDAAFLSPTHRAALESGRWTLPAYGALVADHARFIAADLAGVPRHDPNGSTPLQWLAGGGAIAYRWTSSPEGRSYVALVPNRVAWCLSLLGVLVSLARLPRRMEAIPLALVVIWLSSLASMVVLQHTRVLYAYHHFIPLICGYALGGQALRLKAPPEGVVMLLQAALLAGFALLVPFVYAQPVQPWRCQLAGLGPC
nr:phospholipid carrier-dependent glycosyltransferase [Novosphingobium piscinae]